MSGYIIFDTKIDFTSKAIWILNDHKQTLPKGTIYTGVVSCKSTKIAFIYTTLNNIDI